MQLPSLAFLALALAVLPFAPTQDAAEKLNPREAEALRIRSGVQGAWQLVRVQMGAETIVGANCEGYMLVLPNYVSLQARLASPSFEDPKLMFDGLSAGTHKWQYEPSRMMLVFTSLLSATDMYSEEGEVEYEAPGSRREYRIELLGDDLTLDRVGITRMQFRRMAKGEPAEAPRKSTK